MRQCHAAKKDALPKHWEGIHGHIYNSRCFQYTAAAVTVFHLKTYAACKRSFTFSVSMSSVVT